LADDNIDHVLEHICLTLLMSLHRHSNEIFNMPNGAEHPRAEIWDIANPARYRNWTMAQWKKILTLPMTGVSSVIVASPGDMGRESDKEEQGPLYKKNKVI
jgi:hypothetical protein